MHHTMRSAPLCASCSHNAAPAKCADIYQHAVNHHASTRQRIPMGDKSMILTPFVSRPDVVPTQDGTTQLRDYKMARHSRPLYVVEVVPFAQRGISQVSNVVVHAMHAVHGGCQGVYNQQRSPACIRHTGILKRGPWVVDTSKHTMQSTLVTCSKDVAWNGYGDK